MTGPFTTVVGPVLWRVVEFQEGLRRGEHPRLEAFKRELTQLMNEAQKQASGLPQLADDFALARYALVYWVDEVVLTSSWSHAGEWKNVILELDLFGPPRRAANDFWVRAKQAENRALGQDRVPRSTDPLETFFLCVALGFRGELFLDEVAIKQWVERAHRLVHAGVTPANAAPPAPLGAGYWGLKPLAGVRSLEVASVLISVTAVLTLLAFIAAVHNRGY